jgi:hypothetical protein
MTIAPWPEWLPDQADFGSPGSPIIKNVIPLTAKSYGPMLSAAPASTNALDEPCQGSYSVKAADGSVWVYAGDRTKLYAMPPSAPPTFGDISRTAGGPYATLPPLSGGFWDMTSFGSRVIATNGVDPVQTVMIGGPNFEDLQPGDPVGPPIVPAAPLARFCATVKDFLFLADTTDDTSGHVPYRVHWSALGDVTAWPTPGSVEAQQLQSDYQDIQQTDLGNITGLVSGFSQAADVAIFLERGIVVGNYSGPPTLFQFRTVTGSTGTIAPLSIVQAHARDQTGALHPVVYYLGEDGFAAFDGSSSFPIGSQKFDRTFFQLLDPQYLRLVQGAVDPRSRAVLWAFSAVGSGGLYNRLLVYNWELSRASLIELEPTASIEWFTTSMYGNSYTLDQLDPFGDLETILPSFDDPYWVGQSGSRLTFFDATHTLAFGGGPAMAPTLETGEMQPTDGKRAWVQLIRPLNDGGTATIAVGHRERPGDPVYWEPAVPVNEIGECPQRCTGRYLRFRMAMPAGQVFRHLQGLDLQIRPEASLR